jgi:hypothetical protein
MIITLLGCISFMVVIYYVIPVVARSSRATGTFSNTPVVARLRPSDVITRRPAAVIVYKFLAAGGLIVVATRLEPSGCMFVCCSALAE